MKNLKKSREKGNLYQEKNRDQLYEKEKKPNKRGKAIKKKGESIISKPKPNQVKKEEESIIPAKKSTLPNSEKITKKFSLFKEKRINKKTSINKKRVHKKETLKVTRQKKQLIKKTTHKKNNFSYFKKKIFSLGLKDPRV